MIHKIHDQNKPIVDIELTWFWFCANGPRTYPHFLQSYLMSESCGSTPVDPVTTPCVL